MDVHHLDLGEHAPDDSDRLRLTAFESGKIGFVGIRLNGNVTSHSVSPDNFDTEDEALAAGLTWAEDNDVKVLYVERPDA